jgi:hypothetical protein
VDRLVIGAVEELWSAVSSVEYPSKAKFQRLVMSPEVQAIEMREAGLAGQLLILTTCIEV